jgi:hypothetical protein
LRKQDGAKEFRMLLATKEARLALLALAWFCCSTPAFSERDVLLKTNMVPEVCGPVYKMLLRHRDYIDYDPEKVEVDDYSLRSAPRIDVQAIEWRDPMWWGTLRDMDKNTFLSLMGEGEQYDSTYFVQKTAMLLWGENKSHRVFKLTPKSKMSKRRLPEIFVKDDGSSLSKVMKELRPSDMLQRGPRGYPIVRRPGYVGVYQIDVDKPGEDFERQTFKTSLICEFSLAA